MIKTITIKNFKSVTAAELPLGNVNVFIGANGSGKSNILEAVGMVAAERACQIEVNAMVQKGIRIAKPNLMVSSFYGQIANNTIRVNVSGTEGERIQYAVYNPTPEDIYSTWESPYPTGENRGDTDIDDVAQKQKC
ncbi:AAA family ATPase [Parabacteroides sp.]